MIQKVIKIELKLIYKKVKKLNNKKNSIEILVKTIDYDQEKVGNRRRTINFYNLGLTSRKTNLNNDYTIETNNVSKNKLLRELINREQLYKQSKKQYSLKLQH